MIRDTETAALRGDFHFPGGEAALCADCSRCFPISARSASDGVYRCPACGSTSFIMVEISMKALGERANRMERAVRWALGERVEGIEEFCPPRWERAKYWWRETLRKLAFGDKVEVKSE